MKIQNFRGVASLVAQLVKNLPAMQETQIQFLCWEDPLKKERATHSSILGWRIPWTEEPSDLQPIGNGLAQNLMSSFYSL